MGQFLSPSGKLALTLDQSSIPPNFPVQLNTTYWQFFLPNLYASTHISSHYVQRCANRQTTSPEHRYFKFPNAGMKFEVVGTSPPVTTIGTTGTHDTSAGHT